MVFDATENNIVLFGGVDASGTYLNDTWIYKGSDWVKKSPVTSPPSRKWGTMVYDRFTGRVLMFGGIGDGLTALGDTWSWDGTDWIEYVAASHPSPRRTMLAYNAFHKRIVLFGGDDTTTVYGDTWTRDETTANWNQQFPLKSPPARAMGSMAYSPAIKRVVLTSGNELTGASSRNDTWAWDGTNWANLHPATLPPTRYAAGMAYDTNIGSTLSIPGGLVLFGGYSPGNARNDTWFGLQN